jgi:hypothetical protein
MPNTIVLQPLSFVDARGDKSVMKFFISYDTVANGSTLVGSLASALAGVTNSAQNGGSGLGALPPVPGTLGTQATYGSIEDKLVLTFVDSAGNLHRWQVPAPKSALFLADQETADSANAALTTLVNVLINAGSHPYFVSSRHGEAMQTFAGGVRIRRKLRRRKSIFTRNPTETGPD